MKDSLWNLCCKKINLSNALQFDAVNKYFSCPTISLDWKLCDTKRT